MEMSRILGVMHISYVMPLCVSKEKNTSYHHIADNGECLGKQPGLNNTTKKKKPKQNHCLCLDALLASTREFFLMIVL